MPFVNIEKKNLLLAKSSFIHFLEGLIESTFNFTEKLEITLLHISGERKDICLCTAWRELKIP